MAIDTLGANALASNSITTAKIAADAITTAKIANDAVTGAKIPADAVVAADIADGSVSTAKLADNAVTGAKLYAENLGRRNLIINGDFQINQRGNGSGVGDAGYIGVDRWRGYISTSSTITFEHTVFAAGQSDVDKNLRHFLRFDWLGTGSATTKILNQRIEGAEKGNGQNVTLSFWGRTEQADDCTLRLIQNFGSGGSSQTNTDSGTIDLTTSWQYFTHTFALPSTSGKTVGTNHFLELQFIFGPATLNSYFDITGVQLEYGDTATDFEHRSYGEELSLCQRYFERFTGCNTHVGLYSGSTYIGHIFYKVTKRTRPTFANASGAYTALFNNSGGDLGGTDNMYFTGAASNYLVKVDIDAEL